MGRRFGPRIAIIVRGPVVGGAGVGLVATLILNTFVLDEYDAYGEVPVPGSTQPAPAGGRGDRQLPHHGHRQPVEVDFRSRI